MTPGESYSTLILIRDPKTAIIGFMALVFDDSPVRLLDAVYLDIDELCTEVKAWDLDLRTLSSPNLGGSVGHIVQTRFGPLDVGYARLSFCSDQYGSSPTGQLTFIVLEDRMARLWWRGRDVDRDTVLVCPAGSEVRCMSGPDFEIHTISISQETVAGVCESFKITLPKIGLLPEVFHPEPHLLNALRTQFRRFYGPAAHQAALPTISILEALVLSWLRQTKAKSRPRPSLRARDRAIKKCLELIDQSEGIELSSGLLCEIGGVSERTLQYAFHERFGLSPAAFHKARRMTAARREILHARNRNGDSKIGDIAAAFGFWHVGHFAADFRRAFGETPSAALRR